MGLGRPSPRIHRVAMGLKVKRKPKRQQARRPALRRLGAGPLAAQLAWPALSAAAAAAGLSALVLTSAARAQDAGLPRIPGGATTQPVAVDPLSALRSPELKGKTVEG